jgi:putative ABC transport system substrate-binding protein
MRRRELIAALGAALILPQALRAQQPGPPRRVGILFAQATADFEYEGRIEAIIEALRGFGWIEGSNLKLSIHRVPPVAAEIRKHIAELLAENPDLIVTGGGTTTTPVLQATSTIPVVFTVAVDPVGNGFVDSLSRPGRNATGIMQFDYSLSGKWLELLKQVAPSARRVGVVRDAHTSAGIGQFAVLQSVAASFGVEIFPIGTGDAAEVEASIGKLTSVPNGGLVVTVGAGVNAHREHIISLVNRHRLPAVYANRAFVDRGGLVSYGSDTIASARRAAAYVDRILKGEKPADLPVQAPNKYELVVNLKAAKALAFELPATLLASADEVIE